MQLFEIKHSTEKHAKQCRYLLNAELLCEVESYYGKIVKRTVLYKGKNLRLANDIEYKNVEEYLVELGKKL